MYYSTKTFGHDLGLSCCFRQYKADSHCNLLHGYAISIRLVFKAETLDDRNWVVDFGGLKELKELYKRTFDHKTLVAEDDPQIDELFKLRDIGLIDLVLVPSVGCESFAKFAFELADLWLHGQGLSTRVSVHSCEVAEHGANSAIYMDN